MKRYFLLFAFAILCMLPGCKGDDLVRSDLRAPAYPLVTIDPYTSAWSMTDNLYDDQVKHWTEKEFPLVGAIKVDGEVYRFMGTEAVTPVGVAVADDDEVVVDMAGGYLENTAVQTDVYVNATQTYYSFTCGPVDLGLVFTAPAFLDDLELLSRPVNYISYSVNSNDGQEHDISLYFEASPLWALNTPDQECVSERFDDDELAYLKSGSKSQEILVRYGDKIRIEWGYFYLAAEKDGTVTSIGTAEELRAAFVGGGEMPEAAEGENGNAQMGLVREIGLVANADGKLMIGYDDIYSIQYFGENLRPYWNADGDKTILDMFHAALSDYDGLIDKCAEFDAQLLKEASKAGGRKYAELCVLAYREAIAAHKLVKSSDGELHFMSKENSSNGSIGTVDITYPSAPLFLYYNPELAKALMNHIFYYSESGLWEKPFPAHDVGRYPLANGQKYSKDMPIEEDGNMLIITAAVCKTLGEASYAEKHWDVLTLWVDYLMEYGFDPEDQLCTDDFAGHIAHNVNLSAKAIVGIAAYGLMAEMLGKEDVAEKYLEAARQFAGKWVEEAKDGDHYKLVFDKEGTWSQKYNLVWDKIFGLDLFPKEVYDAELAYYLTQQNEYGLPLDCRETYTKSDWIMWTATLADSQELFDAFIDPMYEFMNCTEDRVPMTDWYWTDKPNYNIFKARAVVGGYFIKMLDYRGL